ncbi:hypothetical protein [Phaeobacter inhibens]|uniref:hypothetical protein n=1 Tax=Phaeobacter inhibens TaxID=221822 RepID=UPI0021A58A4F|nr:hypothetical protein [Phaeobacter inhibens]
MTHRHWSQTSGNPTYVEGATASDLFNTVTASTVESGEMFTGLTLTVTNVSDGAAEVLNFDGSQVSLTHGFSATTATNGLSVTVSLSGTTATVSFSGASLSAAGVCRHWWMVSPIRIPLTIRRLAPTELSRSPRQQTAAAPQMAATILRRCP